MIDFTKSGSVLVSNYSKIIPHYKINNPLFKRRLNRKYKSAYERRDIHTIKELAKQNHAPSLHTLGELIEIYETNITDSFKLFQKSADLGYPEAFSSLSFYLRYGFESYNIPQNRLMSAIYTNIGAEGNSIRSLLTLANDYKHSFIRPRSYRSSIEILLKLDSSFCSCIESGDCNQFIASKIKRKTMKTVFMNHFFQKNIQILQYKANLGDRKAMFELAKMYYNLDEIKNITEAYKLFSKIANYRNSEARHILNKGIQEAEGNNSPTQEKIANNYSEIRQNSFQKFSKFKLISNRMLSYIKHDIFGNISKANNSLLNEKEDEYIESDINDPLVSKSLSYIARMYHLGQFFEKNVTKARELYLKTHNEITSIAGLGLINLEDGSEEEAEILLSIAARMGHLGAAFNLASLHYSKNKSLGISEFFSLADRPDSNFLLAQLNVASMLSQGIASEHSIIDEYQSLKYLWRIAQKGIWNNASDIASNFLLEKEKTADIKRRKFLVEKALLIWLQLADMGMKIPAFNAGVILLYNRPAIRRYDFFKTSDLSQSLSDEDDIRKALSNLKGILNKTNDNSNGDDQISENFFGWSDRKMLKIAVRMFKICNKSHFVSLSYLKMNETAKCLKYLKKIKSNKSDYINIIFIKLMLEDKLNNSFRYLFGNLTQLKDKRKKKLDSTCFILTIQIWAKFVYKLFNFYLIESEEEKNDLILKLKTFRIDLINIFLLVLLLKLVRVRVWYFFH